VRRAIWWLGDVAPTRSYLLSNIGEAGVPPSQRVALGDGLQFSREAPASLAVPPDLHGV